MLCKQWLTVCSQQWWLSSKQMQFQCPHSATLPLSHWHMYTVYTSYLDHTKSEHLSTQCAQFDTPHWPHFEVCWFCRGWTDAAWWWWSPTLLGSCVCICICICVKVLSRNHKNELQADDGGRPLPCHYQSLVVPTHHQSQHWGHHNLQTAWAQPTYCLVQIAYYSTCSDDAQCIAERSKWTVFYCFNTSNTSILLVY